MCMCQSPGMMLEWHCAKADLQQCTQLRSKLMHGYQLWECLECPTLLGRLKKWQSTWPVRLGNYIQQNLQQSLSCQTAVTQEFSWKAMRGNCQHYTCQGGSSISKVIIIISLLPCWQHRPWELWGPGQHTHTLSQLFLQVHNYCNKTFAYAGQFHLLAKTTN